MAYRAGMNRMPTHCSEDHAVEGGDANGFAACRSRSGGDDHGEYPDDERNGRHHHGAEALPGPFQGGFLDGNAALPLHLGEFHHQNGVFPGQAYQHHQAELSVNAQGRVADNQAEQSAQQGHGDGNDERKWGPSSFHIAPPGTGSRRAGPSPSAGRFSHRSAVPDSSCPSR